MAYFEGCVALVYKIMAQTVRANLSAFDPPAELNLNVRFGSKADLRP